MGFLDHSTNNIIVDAVLTDYGRKKLAEAGSSGDIITYYGFADDEVDYTMIKKYGLIVGKEKIEKNTPVFEASTNAEYGIEYYLFTVTDGAQLLAQSVLNVSNSSAVANILRAASSAVAGGPASADAVNQQDYTVSLTEGETASFEISYDKRFLQITSTVLGTDDHPTNSNRNVATIAAGTNQFSLTFQSAQAGSAVLAQRGASSEMSQFTITSSKGHIFHQTIEVSY